MSKAASRDLWAFLVAWVGVCSLDASGSCRAPAPFPRVSQAEREATRLNGVWRVVKGDSRGGSYVYETITDQVWTFSAGKLTIRYFNGSETEFEMKLNNRARPRHLDLSPPRDVQFGPYRGVYQLDEGRLNVCLSRDDTRPTSVDRVDEWARGQLWYQLEPAK